jgi:hypothetical protein
VREGVAFVFGSRRRLKQTKILRGGRGRDVGDRKNGRRKTARGGAVVAVFFVLFSALSLLLVRAQSAPSNKIKATSSKSPQTQQRPSHTQNKQAFRLAPSRKRQKLPSVSLVVSALATARARAAATRARARAAAAATATATARRRARGGPRAASTERADRARRTMRARARAAAAARTRRGRRRRSTNKQRACCCDGRDRSTNLKTKTNRHCDAE